MKKNTAKKSTKAKNAATNKKERFLRFKASHYIILSLIASFIGGILLGVVVSYTLFSALHTTSRPVSQEQSGYWLVLHRKSQKEFLYRGVLGDKNNSLLIRTFSVKTGRVGERPTPLPQALGKKYWKIVKKYPTDNPETAPFFLELDVPVEDGFFGPVPYNECNGQCSWEVPGYFGLHGVNGVAERLSAADPGSSGCIRHSDKDISYLYNLLEVDEGVRYYVFDL